MNMAGANAGRSDAVPGWAVAPRAVPRRPRARPLVSPMGVGLGCGAALVCLMAAAGLVMPLATPRPAPAPISAARPTASAWADIVRPLQLFSLAGSPYTKLPLAYGARRRTDGGVRQDMLTFGLFDGAAPYLNLTFTRVGQNAPPAEADLVVEFARIAAADGVALVRAGLPVNLATRFGPFAVASVTLKRGEATQPCLGFRLQPDSAMAPTLDIRGLACGADPLPIQPEDLACVLDRIDLVAAGEDTTLRDAFTAAERRRTAGCGTSR